MVKFLMVCAEAKIQIVVAFYVKLAKQIPRIKNRGESHG